MNTPKIQLHFLTSYGASLLNRDDAGFAKRLALGSAVRTRISSQCQKRAWRESLLAMDQLPTGVRSCSTLEQLVLPRVLALGVDEKDARTALRAILELAVKGGGNEKDKLSLVTNQPLFLGTREVDLLVDRVGNELLKGTKPGDVTLALGFEEMDKAGKKRKPVERRVKSLAAVLGVDDSVAYGVETALFGRFVTSDVLERTDSSVSVAHAVTVHAAAPELDFFAVVDDLAVNGGSDHIGDVEVSAGVFYGYINIDVAGLIANLTGCKPEQWREQDAAVARSVISTVLRLAVTKSPGAKHGSTAPFARSGFVLIEVGEQERQLVNAFLKPVRATQDEDMEERAALAMADFIKRDDEMYGLAPQRFVSSIYDSVNVQDATRQSLSQAIESALQVVFAEKA